MFERRKPRTLFGLKLKLLGLMLVQLLAWLVLSTFQGAPLLGGMWSVLVGAWSSMILAAVYVLLGLQIAGGKNWAKSTIATLNLALVALAVFFPLLPRLLGGFGLLSPEKYLLPATDRARDVVAAERLANAESVLSLSELWPNLVILFCAGMILNMLRKHTLMGLWDNGGRGTGHRRYHIQLSVGNSFITGIFLTLAFYSLLISVPDHPPILLSAKKLFFGSHVVYYIILLIFWWAFAFLVSDYLVISREQQIHRRIVAWTREYAPHTLRRANALFLLSRIEKEFSPVHFSPVAHRIHSLLEAIIHAKSGPPTGVMQHLDDAEFHSYEGNRSFLATLLWSLPLLGFMGTILGIIDTISAFSRVLERNQQTSGLLNSLGGLSLAIETTLIGLSTALIGGYLFAIVRRHQWNLNASVSRFCHEDILTKLVLSYKEPHPENQNASEPLLPKH